MKHLLLAFIRTYKRFLSKKINSNCQYFPTCSVYSMQAIEEWGSVVGIILTIGRVIRCNPLTKGGFNPIPRKKKNIKWLI